MSDLARWRRLLPRLRFSLRTLLLGVVAVSVFFAWRYDRHRLVQRVEALEQAVLPGRWSGHASWSAAQATGAPDTPGYGDIATAWASRTPDGERERLQLDYRRSVWPTEVQIHETFNPGAVYKVSVFKPDGTEVVAWTGTDPTPPGSGRGVSKIPINVDFKTRRVKIYLDCPAVPGWNEIDAVGLRDWWGRVHWAESARASSSFGENGGSGSAVVRWSR